MAEVSSKLMWIGFALFAFGLILAQLLGSGWWLTAIVFVGVVLYLVGAFELTGGLHDTESRVFRTSAADILAVHVSENDKLMLTGLGIFILGAGLVATGTLPVKYGFVAALGGLLMYVGGAFSFAEEAEALRRQADR